MNWIKSQKGLLNLVIFLHYLGNPLEKIQIVNEETGLPQNNNPKT